jgi:uncharacterized protein YceH (UPF0502 family)
MDVTLNAHEARALGALVEKELTTPEYYPLSLNALTAACNQKSNREPVMSLSEQEVEQAVMSLKNKRLAWRLASAGGRVPKYEHNVTVHYSLSTDEAAVLCTLLLRGPQTAGEIRQRTMRMHEFPDLAALDTTLQRLQERDNGPFIAQAPRAPGRKEARYMHLFGDQSPAPDDGPDTSPDQETGDGRDELHDQIAALRRDLDALRDEFDALKNQLMG